MNWGSKRTLYVQNKQFPCWPFSPAWDSIFCLFNQCLYFKEVFAPIVPVNVLEQNLSLYSESLRTLGAWPCNWCFIYLICLKGRSHPTAVSRTPSQVWDESSLPWGNHSVLGPEQVRASNWSSCMQTLWLQPAVLVQALRIIPMQPRETDR